MRLQRRRTSLVDRLRPYVDTGPPPEPMVSADPIRMFLYRWMIETGDPIEVVAKGFGLDEELVAATISGDSALLTETAERRIRRCLGMALDH